jgi:Glycosyltransferases involved in cell wall biogenesis
MTTPAAQSVTPPWATITVDIILPCFNGARYLREMLESIQRQSHREWRLWGARRQL